MMFKREALVLIKCLYKHSMSSSRLPMQTSRFSSCLFVICILSVSAPPRERHLLRSLKATSTHSNSFPSSWFPSQEIVPLCISFVISDHRICFGLDTGGTRNDMRDWNIIMVDELTSLRTLRTADLCWSVGFGTESDEALKFASIFFNKETSPFTFFFVFFLKLL